VQIHDLSFQKSESGLRHNQALQSDTQSVTSFVQFAGAHFIAQKPRHFGRR
jgi:hypothetical protein